jgi:serine/threonine-protein kinase RsbW
MSSRAIHLRADFADLPRLAEWVQAQASEFSMTERQLYAIQLCLEEVVANLVMHAQPGAGPGVAVTVRIEAEPLRVTVEDDAIPFDPSDVVPAALPTSLEEVRPGGLGLALVQGFSAWRDYVREAGRNRLIMGFA